MPSSTNIKQTMPRKKNPILMKVWDHLIAFRKPKMVSLFLFKRRPTKKVLLLKHCYNHNHFLTEYEFSPSNTLLFRNPWRRFKKRRRFLSIFLCGGINSTVGSSVGCGSRDEREVFSIAGDQSEPLDLDNDNDDDYDDDVLSVDRRAERFIQRFYEEIRVQRRRSL